MKKIFVNGSFDLIHLGHLGLLSFAKSLGTELTVGIDSDKRVAKLKGPMRPINKAFDRITLLNALKCVDNVVVFDTDEELIDLIKKCDIMVKGSDYRGQPIVGEEFAKEIVFFERIDGYSTTEKIQYIVNRG